ncbi:hypothetical protein M9H77_09028 [Catharanthus roseus]|uniref:Uncharacterized protein n=1 Tax=Catharanthus roseus TaxID=4058 RepID=A0ACC0BZT1_CATRO|nr:hypothetical protein M9H77_09028 [Catharanthus roseus]
MWAEGAGPDVGKGAVGETGGLSGEGRRLVGLGPIVEGGSWGGRGEAGAVGVARPRWTGPAEGSPSGAGSVRVELELFSFLAWVPIESDESEQFHKLVVMEERREGSIVFKIHEFTKAFISHHSSSLTGSPSGIGIVPFINPNVFFKRKAKRMAFAHSA